MKISRVYNISGKKGSQRYYQEQRNTRSRDTIRKIGEPEILPSTNKFLPSTLSKVKQSKKKKQKANISVENGNWSPPKAIATPRSCCYCNFDMTKKSPPETRRGVDEEGKRCGGGVRFRVLFVAKRNIYVPKKSTKEKKYPKHKNNIILNSFF